MDFSCPLTSGTTLSSISLFIRSNELYLIYNDDNDKGSALLYLLGDRVTPRNGGTNRVFIHNGVNFINRSTRDGVVASAICNRLTFNLRDASLSHTRVTLGVTRATDCFGLGGCVGYGATRLSNNAGRVLTLTYTVATSPSILLLSRPYSRLSPITTHGFCSTILHLGTRQKVAVLITSRHPSLLTGTSSILCLGRNETRFFNAPTRLTGCLPTTNSPVIRVLPTCARVLGAHALSFSTTGRVLGSITRGPTLPTPRTTRTLDTHNLTFTCGGNTRSILFNLSCATRGNYVGTIMNTGNSKGAALLGYLYGVLGPCNNGVGVRNETICVPRGIRTVFLRSAIRDRVRSRTLHHGFNLTRLTRTGPFSLSNNRTRHLTVTGTIRANTSVLLLSRPAGDISTTFGTRLTSVLGSLYDSNGAVILIARSVRFTNECTSFTSFLFSKGVTTSTPHHSFFTTLSVCAATLSTVANNEVVDISSTRTRR